MSNYIIENDLDENSQSFSSMSDAQKEKLIIINTLPKKHPFHEMIKNNMITEEEFESLSLAFSIGGSVRRRRLANQFTAGSMFRRNDKEVEEMQREILIRTKMRKSLNSIQKSFFKNCLINGWGQNKEDKAISKNIGIKFGQMASNETVKKEFLSVNIDLSKQSDSFIRARSNYVEKLSKIYKCIPAEKENFIYRISELVNNSKFEIRTVANQYQRILKGKQRKYLGNNTELSKNRIKKNQDAYNESVKEDFKIPSIHELDFL